MADSPTPQQLTGVRLDDLIAGIRKAYDDPLEQLTGAMNVSAHLGEVGDSLIGHFVDQARRAGESWTAIGSSMGVTKQAAQKRFVSRPDTADPFSRFTPRARNLITGAHNDALAAGDAAVTPRHLARHLLADRAALAVVALGDAGADVEALVGSFGAPEAAAASTDSGAPTVVPYDDASTEILKRTLAVALERGHNYIGTEHLLLALFDDDVVSATLTEHGADPNKVDAAITKLLGGLS
ncbi:hypothetical protein GOARA_013_00800 [Gordonia araii NBRC 100433]|uniref:Clp R domain-containing protein n=1 Tax=Gordonia araii NBRC 100433 TaxID=1073574 RepID=G7GYG1_9ACTN|nr:Clp protease N-terminal domain-containing protein [Gordonia araii]NNG97367.1 ATP-dependent Clp protease ATP-binding subunit [Gordonia araii NBRC 100433]GAB08636.1 hypothetical protein GOARA_013_00800 [Gordonia araii NBRC 100433]